MKNISNIVKVIATAVTLIISNAAFAEINVGTELANAMNHQPSIINNLGLDNSRKWTVSSVALSNAKMKKVNQNIPIPEGKYKLMTTTQYLNCGGLEAGREISLSKTVENSSSVSVSNSFNANVEVSASVGGGVGPVEVSGSVSVSAGYDFNKTDDSSHSTSVEISDTENVQFPDEVGVWIFGLYAKVVESQNLPFWIDFELTDDSILNIHLEAKPKPVAGDFRPVSLYTNRNWSGDALHLHNDVDVNYHNLGAKYSNDRDIKYVKWFFEQGIRSITYDNVKYVEKVCLSRRSDNKEFCLRDGGIDYIQGYHGNIGTEQFSRIKVHSIKTKKSVKVRWGNIKNHFTEEQSRFRVNGVLSVKNYGLDSKRFASSRLNQERTEQVCAQQNTLGDAQIGSGL